MLNIKNCTLSFESSYLIAANNGNLYVNIIGEVNTLEGASAIVNKQYRAATLTVNDEEKQKDDTVRVGVTNLVCWNQNSSSAIS